MLPRYVNTWCDKPTVSGKHHRHVIRDIRSAESELRREYGETGIFISPMRFFENQPTPESEEYGDLYLDFDSEDPTLSKLECLKVARYFTDDLDFDEQHLNIYYSGNKGYHIILNAAAIGVKPTPYLRKMYGSVAHNLREELGLQTLDLAIYTFGRVLRVANSQHSKTGRYKIWLPLNTLDKRPHSYIEQMAAKPGPKPPLFWQVQSPNPEHLAFFEKYREKFLQKQAQTPYRDANTIAPEIHGKIIGLPVCIEDILQRFIVSGFRFEAQARVISFCKATGVSEEECLDWLMDKVRANYPPSRHEDVALKLKMSISSIYRSPYTFNCGYALSLTRNENDKEKKVKCNGAACPLFTVCGNGHTQTDVIDC